MGIKTWKQEFYSPISKVSKKNAVAHSLKKWQGLTEENLAKHNLKVIYGDIYSFKSNLDRDWPALTIDSETCALCRHHLMNVLKKECQTCPIVAYKMSQGKGQPTCWQEYDIWIKEEDPRPMIKLLEETLEFTQK